jgi:hypothetical protein
MTLTIKPATAASSPAGHGVDRSDSSVGSSPFARHGRLKNGNPAGDFLAAPRCGAHTRCGGSCRQPAMANGRCRLHGGLSAGPRTPAGLARSRRARWKHGARSAEVRALRRAARTQLRRVRIILARTRLSAGHGVHRSNSAAATGPLAVKMNRGDAEAQRYRGSQEGLARNAAFSPARERSSRRDPLANGVARPNVPNAASRRLCVSAVDLPRTPSAAGHGVHRSNPQSRAPVPALPSRRECLRASASIGGLTYARPLGMGFIA